MPDPTATKYAAYLAIHRTAGTTPRSYADWRGEYERARYALTAQQVKDATSGWTPPSKAQVEAGNYPTAKLQLHGLTLSIENPKGTKRRENWPPVAAHYGRILGTRGADGDHVDVFLGDHPQSEVVFVIDQEHQSGRFDELKCVMGALTSDEARRIYERSYNDGRTAKNMTALTVPQFRDFLEHGNMKRRAAEQVSRYTATSSWEVTPDHSPVRDIAEGIARAFRETNHPTPIHIQEILDEPDRYARKHLKSSVGQKSLHFESAAPVGKKAWTEEDERKHPRDETGEWAPKGEEAEKPAPKPKAEEPDQRLQDHVANLHDAMQEKLGAGKQFLARHAGKPLWISSGDHVRIADDKTTVEHTDPEGKWVRADLAQLDHWADKAGLDPFTGPEGILTKKETADARAQGPAGKTSPDPTASAEKRPGVVEGGDGPRPPAGEELGSGGKAEGKLTFAEQLAARKAKTEEGLRRRGEATEPRDPFVPPDMGDREPKAKPPAPDLPPELMTPRQYRDAELGQANDVEILRAIRERKPVNAEAVAEYQLKHRLPDDYQLSDDRSRYEPTEEPDELLPTDDQDGRSDAQPHDPELQDGLDDSNGLGSDRGSGGDPGPGTDREGEGRGGREGRVGEDDPPTGAGEQPGALQSDGPGGPDLGAEPPTSDQDGTDEPPEDETQPEGPAGINEPYEPLDPEVPEADDSEPPEEYLAHEQPNDLGERIKAGDAAAADEVMRRLDEQYPEGAQGPRADRARAVRKKLVEDFGEKIGGARKDMARQLGPRGGSKKPDDDRPGWARRYSVGQITKSTNKAEEGQWAVYDTKHKTWYGQPRQIGVFQTKEEADRSIPLAEVARSHGVTSRGTGDTREYVIYRKVSDRKHPVVRGGFKSNDEAMRYMAQHPEEIIEHQFPRYEQYQYLDHVQRQGGKPRAGNTTPQDFHQEFGFRGGEFGNWQSGRDGQEALNHAHDALRDLADVLGVEPAGISLGGDLAIAFGARGTGGKDAARAHYEPGARVINLTKMRGAGTLAHEFAHAIDNYFARQARVPGERYGKYEWVTEGLLYKHNLRPEVASAWTDLVKTMMARETEQAVDPERIKKQQAAHWDHVKARLDSLETSMAGDRQYNKRHKEFTPEQQAEWDATKAAILSGQAGEKQFVEGRSRFGGYETYANLAKLNQLYKARTGRSFHTAQDGSQGKDLFWSIQNSLDAEKKIQEAQAGKTETKKQATNYYKAARDLDETRASSYYTIPTEMLARAFEAYVYDKLAAEGRRSDYLVGKAENKYYKAFDMAPFPEGDERQAINAAFDRLFSTMQQRPREDEKGQHVELYNAEPLRRLAKELYAAYLDQTATRGP
jgi:hypothetical protein